MRPGHIIRIDVLAGVVLALFSASLASGPAVAAEQKVSPASASLRVVGSPFDPGGGSGRDEVRIELELPSAAVIDLRIVDFDGHKIKRLATAESKPAGLHTWTWHGRDGAGTRVPDGAYRVKASITANGGTVKRRAWVTRARRVPYPRRPGAIVVAIDPGHGGAASGAVWRHLREDTVNLDISLRLEAMLKGAGIGVVMTRRTDRNVSPVGKDINFDGKYDRTDELIARNDVANQARADIHLAIHNNASGCRCTRGTEMYTHFRRSWSPEGRKLARFLLDEHIVHLKRQRGYRPIRRGVFSHPFKALKPYQRKAMPRPSLQPSVLGESLFIDQASEHRILARHAGRSALAAAYFDGIARYLSWRPYGLHYRVLQAPRRAVAASRIEAKLQLTNTGHHSSAGWRLVARVARKVPRYDGRPRRGTIVARTRIPDGLAPGQSLDVVLDDIPVPGRKGEWLLKFDVRLPGGGDLSRHGVVGPQLRLTTTPRS